MAKEKTNTREKQEQDAVTVTPSRRAEVLELLSQIESEALLLQTFISEQVTDDIGVHGKHAPTTIVGIAARLNGALTNLEVANHITRFIIPKHMLNGSADGDE